MVLKTEPGVELFFSKFSIQPNFLPVFTSFKGFYRAELVPDSRFSIELVERADPVRFLKHSYPTNKLQE